MTTPRDPDRFEAKADEAEKACRAMEDPFTRPMYVCRNHFAAALRAEREDALNEAAKYLESFRSGAPSVIAAGIRALIPPAAAPAAETCRAECASRMPCALPMGHVGPHRDYSPGWTVAPPSDPAVPAGEPGKAEVCRAEAASRMPDYSHYECTLPKGHGGPHREGSVEWTDKDTVYP